MKKNRYVVLAVVVPVITAAFVGCRQDGADVPREQALYEKNCAVCHGDTGDGEGKAAYLLQPKPRNFHLGKFRIVSTANFQPTGDDLFQTISNGMPGTAMPPWAHLPEADRRSLADYVLQLARKGLHLRGLGFGYTEAEAADYAEEMIAPGEPIAVPPEPQVSEQGLSEGRQYYVKVCGNCHGDNGEGKQDPTWRTAEGFPTWSRALKEGVYKGGSESEQIFLRFYTGLPGTPMPAGELNPEQVWRVVQYVESLADPDAQERAQVRALEIAAKRVEEIPSDAKAAGWDAIPSTRIALMPLWWHDGYLEAVRVKAAHDGQRLALLLEWDDATRDAKGVEQDRFPDGAAVQWSAAADPPLFAMGADGASVNIWHWKALWSEDQKAFQDVATIYPGMVSDSYYGSKKGWEAGPLDDPLYRPAAELKNSVAGTERSSTVEDANVAGFGTFTSQTLKGQNVEGAASWDEGVWRLQLVRALGANEEGDVDLTGGTSVSVAFGVWDGSAGDRDGQKSVSIWNTLALE